MAFDKNNTSTWMKVVIVIFAVILVVSMCVPFFSSCSFNSADTSQDSDDAEQQATTDAAATTVASVKAQYAGVISNLEQKLADDAGNTTAMASLGNNYMDMAAAMRSASDYSDNTDEVEAAYAKAADYYEQYLAKASSQAVSVDHAICLFYGGKADEGISELAEYVKGDGADYAMAWFNLAIMHYTSDTPDYAAAVEEFNKAAELDSDGSAGVAVNAQIYSQLAQSALDAQNKSDDDATEGGDSDTSDDAGNSAAGTSDDANDAADTTDTAASGEPSSETADSDNGSQESSSSTK